MAFAAPAPTIRRGPRARTRSAFRQVTRLPAEPTGLQILAAIKLAREAAGRAQEWDARLETSAIAVLAYLWRRGHGERWAGRHGSATYGCSLAQIVAGLTPIMGWQRREPALLLARHRKTVQRWLDWLQLAGLIEHTPQQDQDGFWWRTIITLRPCPDLPDPLLEAAAERRRGWWTREERRARRALRRRPEGHRRNLTAILRRARLTRAQRRARASARRKQCAQHTERLRVRACAAESLRLAANHLTHPFGAETTSRGYNTATYQDETSHRGHARASNQKSSIAPSQSTQHPASEQTANVGIDLRWAIYRDVMARRFHRRDDDWALFVAAVNRRANELAQWPERHHCPRSRVIEAWTVAAHGAHMAAAGGPRLALWNEEREHHGPRLDRALARYTRYASVRPPGFPTGAIAALGHFFAHHVRRQDGAEHGMAYDVARFNELTTQMRAYAHTLTPTWQQQRQRSARRRAQRARELLTHAFALRFRTTDPPDLELLTARELLDRQADERRQFARRLPPSSRPWSELEQRQRVERRDHNLLHGLTPTRDAGAHLAAAKYRDRWLAPSHMKALSRRDVRG